MKRPGVYLNAIVACLLTVAAVAAAPGDQTGQGVVTGIVTDPVTRRPIAGALVTINPGGLVAAVTNDAGVYQATLPVGRFSLTVSVPDRPFQSALGVVVTNGSTTTVNFVVSPPAGTGMLTGFVRSAATNTAIANAIVSVNPGGNSIGTDANGRYELWLPVGTYKVSASAVFYSAASIASVTVSSRTITTGNLQLSPKPVEVELLHRFASTADGENPGQLIQATDGDFYGTAPGNGDLSKGTIFKMTPAGTFTPLHQFAGGLDGASPWGPLTQGLDGDFYGTTFTGGESNNGTVFKMSLDGTVTILHVFADGVDGTGPFGSLIQGMDGDFYGTTSQGGAPDNGSVFRITPAGIVTVLHAFSRDEGSPNGDLVLATDGNFYGTTNGGGTAERGTVFKMTAEGAVTVLHSFTGGSDGAYPFVGLIQASDGNFYGTTWRGGSSDGGTIFRITPAGHVTILHSFLYAEYLSRLLQATDGNFYGTTSGDDILGGGTIFRMTPTGTFATLYSFDWWRTTGGSSPGAGLIQGADGDFYGTTYYGGIRGQDGRGTIFRMIVPAAPAAIHSH